MCSRFWRQFQMLHLRSMMEQQKLGGSRSCSIASYLNAFRLSQEWKSVSRRSPTLQNESKCLRDILMTEDKEALCHWLCIFVMEVRKESGDPYTPQSIVQLMSGPNCKISNGSGVNNKPIELLLIHSSHHLSYLCCFCIKWLVAS